MLREVGRMPGIGVSSPALWLQSSQPGRRRQPGARPGLTEDALEQEEEQDCQSRTGGQGDHP